MAESRHSRGPCAYCGRQCTRAGMIPHLRGCVDRAVAMDEAHGKAGRIVPLCHLQVTDGWTGGYWLNLEVDGTATLGDVDAYLRAIWLECCGHPSRFSERGWRGAEIPMTRKVGPVFHPGARAVHVYDFGKESLAVVKCLDVREGPRCARRPIALMARNAAPLLDCIECGDPAERVCRGCTDIGLVAALCLEHSTAHDLCGEPVALVNSPRLGLCAYTGPAEPPS